MKHVLAIVLATLIVSGCKVKQTVVDPDAVYWNCVSEYKKIWSRYRPSGSEVHAICLKKSGLSE